MKRLKNYVVLTLSTNTNEILIIKYQFDEEIGVFHHLINNLLESYYEMIKSFIEDYPILVYDVNIKEKLNIEIENMVIDISKLTETLAINTKLKNLTNLYDYARFINALYQDIIRKQLDEEIKAFIKENSDTVNVSIIQRTFLIGINHAKDLLKNTLT